MIHFAAFKAVVESMTEPLKYYQNNLSSLMNICELMHQFNRPNVLISSSATVYGEAEALPVTEESPRQPATSPYGNTKQMCENILRDCCRAYPGFNGIALRYFNPIGAHPSACIDELPRGMPNNLVPFITQTAAGIRECLSIFGDDYNTPDGTCLRDYIDESRETIPDAVDLLIKSGEATIRVLDTTSRWFGVTYTEDRPMVVEKLSRLHNEGVYPTPLFT